LFPYGRRRVVFEKSAAILRPQTLLESHKSGAFDHSGVQADRNLAFPLDRFQELEMRAAIGVLNHRISASWTRSEKWVGSQK